MATAAAEHLRAACLYAAEHSEDQHTQIGALLVATTGVQVFAANTLPAIHKLPERLVRPVKYHYIEHAERNAVYAAARKGICTEGAILYCPWFACADCARAIIQAGIRCVVGHATPRQLPHEHWRETIAAADQMLAEAGVETQLLTTPLNVVLLFNGSRLEF